MVSKPLIYSSLGPVQQQYRLADVEWDKEFGIHFTNPEMNERFDDYDPIIIVGDTLTDYEEYHGRYKATLEATRIEREIFNSLEKGKNVCLIFGIDKLFVRVFKRIKVIFSIWDEPRVDFRICQSEFNSLLKGFGSTKYFWSGDFDKIIAQTDDDKTVGFSKKVENGNLLYLPCYMSLRDFCKISRVREFIPCLLDTLEKYRPRIKYDPPKWINTFNFPNEEPIVSEIERLKKEIDKRNETLTKYSRLKEVLWYRNNELVDSIINMFKEFGIQTKKDEIYEEDFWIMENGKEIIIVEVKGLDKNLKRPHISQLDEHRGARNKSDDFPALLIVNTFNKAITIKEKDIPISTNEIKKAVRQDILIIRTLDLCNALSLIESEKLTSTQLLELLKSEKGWLSVTKSGYQALKN